MSWAYAKRPRFRRCLGCGGVCARRGLWLPGRCTGAVWGWGWSRWRLGRKLRRWRWRWWWWWWWWSSGWMIFDILQWFDMIWSMLEGCLQNRDIQPISENHRLNSRDDHRADRNAEVMSWRRIPHLCCKLSKGSDWWLCARAKLLCVKSIQFLRRPQPFMSLFCGYTLW